MNMNKRDRLGDWLGAVGERIFVWALIQHPWSLVLLVFLILGILGIGHMLHWW
jgi:hypothetical protein